MIIESESCEVNLYKNCKLSTGDNISQVCDGGRKRLRNFSPAKSKAHEISDKLISHENENSMTQAVLARF